MALARILPLICTLTISNVQGMAIGETNPQNPQSQEDPLSHRTATNNTWIPPDGWNLTEWYRCHGMPCEQWQRTQENTRQIIEIEYWKNNPLASDQPNLVEIPVPEDDTLDGCIWLTEEQSDEILEQLQRELHQTAATHGRRKKRTITDFSTNTYNKWPIDRPIKYKFDGRHTGEERNIIRQAFQQWQDNTCIRFMEVSTNEIVIDNHLLLTAESTGCSSFVGRVFVWPQRINLMPRCLGSFGIPLHEVGHALGLWHEQQRLDRDDHIRIQYENIHSLAGQFAIKHQTVTYGVPYDYGSVMHYSPYDGTVNGKPSMVAHNPEFQRTMGQRVEASFYDIMVINRAYCNNSCSYNIAAPCKHGGYQDPNKCAICKCPPGFTGVYCEQVAPSVLEPCGGALMAEEDVTKELTSPNYYTTKSYQDFQECSWKITAALGQRVVLYFEDQFGIYCHQHEECFHWVEVRYSANLGQPGPRFCCGVTPSIRLESVTNEMAVIFKAKHPTSSATSRRGFKAVFYSVSDSNYIDLSAGEEASSKSSSNSFQATTLPLPVALPPSSNSGPLWWCGFEISESDTWCGIEQETRLDQFDWTLGSLKTPSDDTGPDQAYSGQTYAYIESSNPRRPNDRATLYLPRFLSEGTHCLFFAYNMYGWHIRELQVFLEKDGYQHPVWSHAGQVGREWTTVSFTVALTANNRIGFTGIRGDEYSGDIAIDHIRLSDGQC